MLYESAASKAGTSTPGISIGDTFEVGTGTIAGYANTTNEPFNCFSV